MGEVVRSVVDDMLQLRRELQALVRVRVRVRVALGLGTGPNCPYA